jgi:uncharacterized protein (TIGR03067 family)
MMRSGIAAGVVVVMVALGFTAGYMVSAETPPANAPAAADNLEGVWRLVSGESEGKPLSAAEVKSGKLVIEGDRYTVMLASQGTLKGTQKLDASKSPKTIDAVGANGPDAGKTTLGIYELMGDEFRVALASPGKARPTRFKTSPGSGQWMHVWQRVPK